MRLKDVYNFGRYGSRKKRTHVNVIDSDSINPMCIISEMISIGDAVAVVYAGSYDKYARIIMDLDKFDEYSKLSYVKRVCRCCSYDCGLGGACKLNIYKGLK